MKKIKSVYKQKNEISHAENESDPLQFLGNTIT
jgi:hypothetical protein